MQQQVLESLPDANLAVLTVWEPILTHDDEGAARRAMALVTDERVAQFWAPDLALGHAFAPVLGLSREPAWDVYLVYPPGVRWDEGPPPAPRDFQHQLSGRLPAGKRLDGAALRVLVQHASQRDP